LIIFDQKWVGLHFGQFYHKLIWSTCSPAAVAPDGKMEIEKKITFFFFGLGRFFLSRAAFLVIQFVNYESRERNYDCPDRKKSIPLKKVR
jgi:hypothetical protein